MIIGWVISLCSPLPGLHSGLDSFRFNMITIEQLTVHCRHILRRNQCLSVAVCFQIRRDAARALPVRSPDPMLPGPWNSDQYALLIEYKPTAVASTRGSVGLSNHWSPLPGWTARHRETCNLAPGQIALNSDDS
jgi:hypothetical protein